MKQNITMELLSSWRSWAGERWGGGTGAWKGLQDWYIGVVRVPSVLKPSFNSQYHQWLCLAS
jgi:hypothetical protein